MIYRYADSLGSSLHLYAPSEHIAYAQWPSDFHWENAGQQLPEEAGRRRNQLYSSRKKIESLYELVFL